MVFFNLGRKSRQESSAAKLNPGCDSPRKSSRWSRIELPKDALRNSLQRSFPSTFLPFNVPSLQRSFPPTFPSYKRPAFPSMARCPRTFVSGSQIEGTTGNSKQRANAAHQITNNLWKTLYG
jgi:hypothetical protein